MLLSPTNWWEIQSVAIVDTMDLISERALLVPTLYFITPSIFASAKMTMFWNILLYDTVLFPNDSAPS